MSDVPSIEVFVPSILGGESISEGSIKSIKVKVGQIVSQDDVMFEIETDKTVLEVNAPKSGTVVDISVFEGDVVTPSQKVAVISMVEAGQVQSTATAQQSDNKNDTASIGVKNSPAANAIVNNANINPSTVTGTGLGGRITKADVVNFMDDKRLSCKQACDSKPQDQDVHKENSSSENPRQERVRMSKIRQITAQRLKEAQNTAAILTTFNEVDLHSLVQLRSKNKDLFEKKFGIRLSFMSFFIKAVISALKAVPEINAEIVGSEIVYKHHYDVGVAVGSDRGLVVPVIKDADSMSLAEIEMAISDFATRARDGKLKVSEMSGATFTISNGGVYGSLFSTPIINPPQSGILGMHAIKDRPVVIDGSICIRPMMYVALSYDHRIVDGKGAVTFLVHVKDLIEDPSKMLLGF